jgi:D-arabinose 1-dehydrogenase-like Zn-dependent alcohol dehydrogenase
LKAVRKIEPESRIVVQETEKPEIGASQVLVEIKATAICGHTFICMIGTSILRVGRLHFQ